MRRFYFLMIFMLVFILHQIPQKVQALDEETRIPAGVSLSRFKLISQPTFSEAYNGFGERVPLDSILIRDEQLKDWTTGSISREATVLESTWVYGISQDWILEMVLPVVSMKQSSSLELKNGAPSNSEWNTILQNLQSETVSGLGDIRLKAGYEMGASTKWFVRGGFKLTLPSGSSGTPRGVYAFSAGEKITDAGLFLHINWYPFVRGLRNGIRFSQSSAMEGERETLSGEKHSYLKGNRLEFQYQWSYERSDFFYGFEIHHLKQLESQLDGGANDQGYLDQGLLEIGWGNLNQLEEKPLDLPWQIRLGHRKPLRGERQFIAPVWQLEAQIYF